MNEWSGITQWYEEILWREKAPEIVSPPNYRLWPKGVSKSACVLGMNVFFISPHPNPRHFKKEPEETWMKSSRIQMERIQFLLVLEEFRGKVFSREMQTFLSKVSSFGQFIGRDLYFAHTRKHFLRVC